MAHVDNDSIHHLLALLVVLKVIKDYQINYYWDPNYERQYSVWTVY